MEFISYSCIGYTEYILKSIFASKILHSAKMIAANWQGNLLVYYRLIAFTLKNAWLRVFKCLNTLTRYRKVSDNASTWTKRIESANIYTSNQLALAALWKPGPRNPAYKRHEICMILHQLFIPHIIQYKNITDILPFSRHFVYI